MPKQVKVVQQVAPRQLAPSVARHTIGKPDLLILCFRYTILFPVILQHMAELK